MIFSPRCVVALTCVFDGQGGQDTEPVILGKGRPLIPKRCTVHLNGYKQADSFDLEFDADRIGLTPDSIRSAAAQVWMFDADQGDDHLERYLTEDNLVILGLADDTKSFYSTDGRTFSMGGQDLTALLLGKKWASGPWKRVPVGRPLDRTVQMLADVVTSGRGFPITVKFKGEGAPPTVGAGLSKTSKRGIPVKGEDSFWDVIYRLCLSHGYIVFVELDKIVISTPQFLSQEGESKARTMAYGRNLSSLEIAREMGREAVPQIRAVSYDSKNRQRIEVLYPAKKDKPTTGIGTKKDEVLIVTAPNNITDKGTLALFAKSYYYAKARKEAQIRWTTKDLVDLDGRSLLRLRAGHPSTVLFDAFNREETRQLSLAERVAHLVRVGYEDEVAQVIAERVDIIARYEEPKYTREITFDWSSQGGLTIDVEAINFVSVGRDDPQAKGDSR